MEIEMDNTRLDKYNFKFQTLDVDMDKEMEISIYYSYGIRKDGYSTGRQVTHRRCPGPRFGDAEDHHPGRDSPRARWPRKKRANKRWVSPTENHHVWLTNVGFTTRKPSCLVKKCGFHPQK